MHHTIFGFWEEIRIISSETRMRERESQPENLIKELTRKTKGDNIGKTEEQANFLMMVRVGSFIRGDLKQLLLRVFVLTSRNRQKLPSDDLDAERQAIQHRVEKRAGHKAIKSGEFRFGVCTWFYFLCPAFFVRRMLSEEGSDVNLL